MSRGLAVSYFGGALGAVACSVALWLVGRAGLTGMIGVSIAPALEWAWLSDRILWGGLWGLGFPLFLRLERRPVRAGLLLSLLPTAAQLLYLFPRSGRGLLGVSLGALTPLVVLAANALWGWTLAHVVLASGHRQA